MLKVNEGHGHNVGRISVGEARVGDRACAKLIRKTEVERNCVGKGFVAVVEGREQMR